MSGYNHKQPILLSKIINKLSVFSVDDKRFEIEKEILARQLRNFKAEQPYTHTRYYLNLLMDDCVWSKEELASALDGTDYCSLLSGLHCAYQLVANSCVLVANVSSLPRCAVNNSSVSVSPAQRQPASSCNSSFLNSSPECM